MHVPAQEQVQAGPRPWDPPLATRGADDAVGMNGFVTFAPGDPLSSGASTRTRCRGSSGSPALAPPGVSRPTLGSPGSPISRNPSVVEPLVDRTVGLGGPAFRRWRVRANGARRGGSTGPHLSGERSLGRDRPRPARRQKQTQMICLQQARTVATARTQVAGPIVRPDSRLGLQAAAEPLVVSAPSRAEATTWSRPKVAVNARRVLS
jgi:hypothetical protein